MYNLKATFGIFIILILTGLVHSKCKHHVALTVNYIACDKITEEKNKYKGIMMRFGISHVEMLYDPKAGLVIDKYSYHNSYTSNKLLYKSDCPVTCFNRAAINFAEQSYTVGDPDSYTINNIAYYPQELQKEYFLFFFWLGKFNMEKNFFKFETKDIECSASLPRFSFGHSSLKRITNPMKKKCSDPEYESLEVQLVYESTYLNKIYPEKANLKKKEDAQKVRFHEIIKEEPEENEVDSSEFSQIQKKNLYVDFKKQIDEKKLLDGRNVEEFPIDINLEESFEVQDKIPTVKAHSAVPNIKDLLNISIAQSIAGDIEHKNSILKDRVLLKGNQKVLAEKQKAVLIELINSDANIKDVMKKNFHLISAEEKMTRSAINPDNVAVGHKGVGSKIESTLETIPLDNPPKSHIGKELDVALRKLYAESQLKEVPEKSFINAEILRAGLRVLI